MADLEDIACKQRKERQDRSAFAALIASPAVGVFVMPANARLAFRSGAGCVSGTEVATLNSRSLKAPTLAAGGVTRYEYVGRSVTVTPASGFDVLIDYGMGRQVKIAEGA